MTAIMYDTEHIRNMRVRVTMYILLTQIYDLFITFKVLNIGGAELNPVAKLLIGLGLIIPLKVGIGALALWKAKYGKNSVIEVSELKAYGLAWFVAGIYTLVCILNTITYYTYAGVQ